MNLFLVHHADALSPAIDPQRPLSQAGHAHAQALAERARDAGIKPAVIWHSGKLRSRQTAEAFLRVCNPFATFRMVRGLRPEDPATVIRDVLVGEDDDLMLVGHMPHLPALRLLLTGGGPFPLHGLLWLVRDDEGRYREAREL
ncbi:MAG TPA: histidine phosphatase family protein [Vicinamibacterales bacterium]|jgi:phosphohistidine phosphatase|nr:histidine phosphatase family protein [Vicinamibacterales bacterium]